MKATFVALGAVALTACYSSSAPDQAGPDASAPGPTTQSTIPTPVLVDGGTVDWQDLYALYFGPNTIGHCAECHTTAQGGFTSGTTADSMYQGMISAGLVDANTPTASPIGIPGSSPLSWYNVPESGKTTLDGRMPDDMAIANAAAAAAVTSWVVAGAQNHGQPPAGSTLPGAGGGDDDDDDGSDAGAGADAGKGTDAGPGAKDGGTDAGGTDGGSATWTDLYTNWFGPSTPGHCGNSYCHQDSGSKGAKGSSFVCGASAATCYQGLVTAGLVDPKSPATSSLGNPTATPLSWFGKGGDMPDDARMTDAAGAAAVTAWLAAGAPSD